MSRYWVTAQFADERAFVRGWSALKDCVVASMEFRTPYPVSGTITVDASTDRLQFACLAGVALGVAIGLAFQAWTSVVSWPLDVGGKPTLDWLAYLPVTFESAMLCAGLATLIAYVRETRRYRHTEHGAAWRSTDDRFVVVIKVKDVVADQIAGICREAGASMVDVTPAGDDST